MSVSNIERIIGYEFNDHDILFAAVVDKSSGRYSKQNRIKFEKLEFLGDRVLGLCLSTLLYKNLQKETEKNYAVRIAHLASTVSLIDIAKKTGLVKHFNLPLAEIESSASSIADTVEAILAAVYLDGGLDNALSVTQTLFGKDFLRPINKQKDYKSRLQEYAQKYGYGLPVYKVESETGLAHEVIFTVSATVNEVSAFGSGKNKKNAEQDAAMHLLKELKNEKI